MTQEKSYKDKQSKKPKERWYKKNPKTLTRKDRRKLLEEECGCGSGKKRKNCCLKDKLF